MTERLYKGHTEEEHAKRESRIALYGAGMVAVSIYYAIKTLHPDCRIVSFIVSETKDNPEEIDHIPVMALEEFSKLFGKQDIKILVAVPENHHSVIVAELMKRNLKDYICMDSQKEAGLMEQYYRRTKMFLPLRSCQQKKQREKEISLNVYITRFHKDVPLKKTWKLPEWTCPIQAGAALTDRSVAPIRDNTGDNISEKNGNYSELSALYWIWKNTGKGLTGDEYVGLFHYRRILDVTAEDIYSMADNGIDVVLPYPTIHAPSIDEHHRRYVKDQDWMAMVSAIEELSPEYARMMPDIFSQPYFYNYNMFIAKRRIFDEFCGWMFPILKRTEELSSPRGWERADRYIGYLGENLTTLYFMYHKNHWKIAHVGRLMLV